MNEFLPKDTLCPKNEGGPFAEEKEGRAKDPSAGTRRRALRWQEGVGIYHGIFEGKRSGPKFMMSTVAVLLSRRGSTNRSDRG